MKSKKPFNEPDKAVMKALAKSAGAMNGICTKILYFHDSRDNRNLVVSLRNNLRNAASIADPILASHYSTQADELTKLLDRTVPNPREDTDSPGPTQATADRARPDFYAEILTNAHWTQDEKDCASEIREVYMALTRGLDAHSGHIDTAGRSTSKKLPRQPVTCLNAHEDEAYVHRYRPWAAIQQKKRINPDNVRSPNYVDLTLRILHDGMTPLAVDTQFNLKPGTTHTILRKSIELYDKIRQTVDHLEERA